MVERHSTIVVLCLSAISTEEVENVCVGVSCRKPESHLDTLRDL